MEQTQKKSILVIKASANSLHSAEGFLRNREWKVKATANLKEALVYLVQEQPSFVMVSVDHPNKKVQKLPKVLAQAFPVCVIAFAEDTVTSSYKALTATATDYQIFPPVTGPSIERMVNKFHKDQQVRAAAGTLPRATGELGEDGVIAIRGGFNSDNAQSLLAQMLGGGDDLQLPESAGNANGNSNGVVAGTSSAPESGSVQMRESHFEKQNEIGSVARTAAYAPETQRSARTALHQADQEGPDAALHQATQKGPLVGDTTGITQLAPVAPRRSAKPKGPQWGPIEPPVFRPDLPTPNVLENQILGKKTDSLIERGTKAALEKSCVQVTHAHATQIEQISNMACILIEATRFSGYLITAMGANKVIDDDFMKKIELRLFTFLKEHGEKVVNGESMNLQLKQVPFAPWALSEAEFLRKSTHKGNEVAMAFFPRKEVQAKFRTSPDEEMAAVHLQEFAGDTQVDFNIYLHLPKNDKYVLYTPRGGMFYDRQKTRLSSQGVEHLHILKAEMQDLNKYRAENYLNENIEDFKRKTPAKKAI